MRVRFEVADIFSWTTTARFDVIFFAAWLSHVPRSRFEQFWASVRSPLAVDGRVCFVDEHSDVKEKETYPVAGDEIVEQHLRDGTTFRIVKNFIDPPLLERQLRAIGWPCAIRRDAGDWICGEARPVNAPDSLPATT